MGAQLGSVFESHSRANHETLVELREILDNLGFRVVKKIDKEDTLRAYSQRLYQYPLLNPRFARLTVRGLHGRFFLEISTWSKGDDRLAKHLRSYRSTTECRYVRAGDEARDDSKSYVLHGWFYIRLHTRNEARFVPDLNALVPALKDLRDFLRGGA